MIFSKKFSQSKHGLRQKYGSTVHHGHRFLIWYGRWRYIRMHVVAWVMF
jgi:hypothetical protein